MAELAVIVPSRGRPERLAEMVGAVFAHAETDVSVWAGIDDDDDIDAYRRALRPFVSRTVFLSHGPRHSLSAWTNALAFKALESSDPPRYFASLGDDHRPRTPAWDRKLIAAIEERGGSGWAYGNDLAQGRKLPTAWVVSADIVKALGWLMLPSCAHMYVDNATLALGEATHAITYVPSVVIEHVHPSVGKAAVDASYAESNAPERYAADREAFESWQTAEGRFAVDADRVRAVLGHTVHDFRRLEVSS